MPRAPRNPPPSSSVARLLDHRAAGRAIEPAGLTAHADVSQEPAENANRRAPGTGNPGAATHAPPTKREVLLSPDADTTLERLVQLLRETTGARITTSHVVRALLRAVAPALPNIRDAFSQLGPLRLPGNGARQDRQRRQFEAQLARALAEGLGLAAPLHREADEPLGIGSDPAGGAAVLRPSSSRPGA